MTSNGCESKSYCYATGVEAEIAFPDTSSSNIPSSNFIEGTIVVKGADSIHAGLDYLIRAGHVLYPNGDQGVIADVWEVCEGLLGGAGSLSGCGVRTYATEMHTAQMLITGLSTSQPIWVQIQVSGTTLTWYYSYNGDTWSEYSSYTMPSTFNPSFEVGTKSVDAGLSTAYYYQFGVFAQSAFSNPFEVEFYHISYYRNSAWTIVPTAQSVYGPNTMVDNDWVLAVSTWDLQGVINPAGSGSYIGDVGFESCTGCSTLPEYTQLWTETTSFVQPIFGHNTYTDSSYTTSFTLTFKNQVTEGDLLVVAVATYATGVSFSVSDPVGSDGQGNTWTSAIAECVNYCVQIFYTTAKSTSSGETVTITTSSTTTYTYAFGSEYSLAAGILDQTSYCPSSCTGTPYASSFTPIQGSVVVDVAADQAGGWTQSSGFTMIGTNTGWSAGSEYAANWPGGATTAVWGADTGSSSFAFGEVAASFE